jgi:hypothetical protein
LSIGFLCENRTVQFDRLDGPFFSENSYIQLFDLILLHYLSYLVSLYPKAFLTFYLIKSSMSGNEEERRVKKRHDVTQYYQRRSFKRTTSRQQLPRGDMMVSGAPNSNSNNSSDDDVEDETYMPSPQARPHEKGLASGSGSGAMWDEEIEEEDDDADGDDAGGKKNHLMWKKSILPTMCTWGLQSLGSP